MSRLLPAPWIAAAAALLATACAGPSPTPPALHVALTHRAGSALGDGRAAAGTDGPESSAATDAQAALALSIEWRWLAAPPELGLLPVGVHALAVAGSGGDEPFSAAPLIIGSVQVALGERGRDVAARLRALPAPASARLPVLHDALPVGVSAVLTPGPLALELSRPSATSGVELALVREGRVPLAALRGDERDAEPGGEREAGDPASVGWREVVLLDTPLFPDGPPAALALPAGSTGELRGAVLVALVEVHAAPLAGDEQAQHAARLAQCLRDVAESAVREAERALAMDAVESKQRQLLAAARTMAAAGDRRRAGVFLASESGASLALDVALVADAAALEALAPAWKEALGTHDEHLVQGDALAWALERTTALWLAQRAEDETLPAELESVLLRQTGVVARSPGLLQQFAEESDGLQSWRARLEQENRLSLEDSLPAARVRAFDWLAARGLQPPDYDPLAARAERQAALLAADETR